MEELGNIVEIFKIKENGAAGREDGINRKGPDTLEGADANTNIHDRRKTLNKGREKKMQRKIRNQ